MTKMLDDDFNESEMFSPAALERAEATQPAGGNPLAGYFRMPGLTVPLPTGGRYLPAGTIEMDATGRVEVFPMGSADELLLKSPDALMSGLAVERLLMSCVPSIKAPQMISAPDLDVLLIAIRVATYGNLMPVDVECPSCSEEMSFDCDLSAVLGTMVDVPETIELRLSKDVIVVMKPHSMASQTKLLLAAYDEQRRAQNIDEDSLTDEQRKHLYEVTIDRFAGFQAQSLTNGIVKIVVPNNEVAERKFIEEFVRKTTKQWQNKIQNKLEEINTMGVNRDIEVKCTACAHEWKSTLEFNPATFFEQSSSR